MNCMYLKLKSKKGTRFLYCAFKREQCDFSVCASCCSKSYKTSQKSPIKCRNTAHSVTRATSIPAKVKHLVWERDSHRCIFCKKEVDLFFANSHYVKRSHLGMGVPENVFTACLDCHHAFDDTPARADMLPVARAYLMSFYPDWNEADLVYKKGASN